MSLFSAMKEVGPFGSTKTKIPTSYWYTMQTPDKNTASGELAADVARRQARKAPSSMNNSTRINIVSQQVSSADGPTRTWVRTAINDPASAVEPGDLTQYGPWSEYIRVMWGELQVDNNLENLRGLLANIAKNDHAFGALMAREDEPAKVRWTPAELYKADFAEPKYIIPELIPYGLSFFAGRPKIGKSWYAMQVAHAVGTGGKLFGHDITKGNVLYIALEDNARRLKHRSAKQGIPADANIEFVTEWSPLNEDGMGDLINEVSQGGYDLVIIDTFSRSITGKADQMDGGSMTDIVGQLQSMGQTYDLSILVIDHHRKKNAYSDDPIDDILGATGKAAVADAAMGLYKERGKAGATLRIVGRDIEEKSLALEWDALTYSWQLVGEAGQVMANTKKADILDAIRTLVDMGKVPTTTRIASVTDQKKGNVSRDIADLLNAGFITKGKKQGREQPYYIPGEHVTHLDNNDNNDNHHNHDNHDNHQQLGLSEVKNEA